MKLREWVSKLKNILPIIPAHLKIFGRDGGK